MSMTDPIADMLSRIRNAMTAGHDSLAVPASSVKQRIVEILQEEGYIDTYSRRHEGPQGFLDIKLKWHAGQPAIEGLRRVSRPGQRRYARCGDIPKVRNGLGIMIVSTSKGLMTDRAARKAGVGGELICSIW
ncbi:30S ribosomal protein S8 [Paraliomyxa miuraensis]|uniref:30S ribosomal protein S8 n=1 Tax=Paraliomyxa miuraensis TaxID=376150 RepID=UPI00224D27C0|nr:30S ribosomal protein S8 [Paraliomyxa miuraensis]MCX4241290.1 30S ribosomal protein S8 [Paraliomyxa miuraensis]